MKSGEIKDKLTDKNLKVTPQRIAILEAITRLNNHPVAEEIIEYIRKKNPNISKATVYKVIETLIQNGLVNKVKTDNDIMRYDAVVEKHHHIYCSDSDRIEDYKDEELDALISGYFKRKAIPAFKIEDIKLQIIGKFINQQK